MNLPVACDSFWSLLALFSGRAIFEMGSAAWSVGSHGVHGPSALPLCPPVKAPGSYGGQSMNSLSQLLRRTEILVFRRSSTAIHADVIRVSDKVLVILLIRTYVVDIHKETQMLLMVWMRHLDFSHPQSPPSF